MARLSRREVLLALAATPALAQFRAFDVAEVDLAGLSAALARGEVTAVSLVQAYLDRIERLDRAGPTLRSVLELNPDALALARAADEERAQKVRGPLHGVPVLVKDNLDTADRMKTTAGSLALLDAPAPTRDAFVVERLRAAGAIILGKTNLSEWANLRGSSSVSGWSARGGQTRNCYALDRNPSGSSSGSAVAVAASLCAVAIGTETDGSIVSPACSQGLVGLKPTLGLVSRSGIIPISASQDTAGPLTRTVRDAAVVLEAIAGADPADAATLKRPTLVNVVGGLEGATLKGARLGVWRGLFDKHPGVGRLGRAALDVMKSAGAALVDVEFSTAAWEAAELEVLLFEQKAGLDSYLSRRGGPMKSLADVIAFNRSHQEELAVFGQELFLESQARGALTSPVYRKALTACGSARKDLEAVFSRHRLDAVVAPTGAPAWLTDTVNGDAFGFSCSSLPAVAGTPHLVVPMGALSGLPVTLSFLGRAFSDAQLLRLGHAFEQLTHARQAPKYLEHAG